MAASIANPAHADPAPRAVDGGPVPQIRPRAQAALERKRSYGGSAKETITMAKGIEKGKTQNKPKLSTKEKQKRKKEKKASRAAG